MTQGHDAQEIGGRIGFYGLGDWWIRTFNPNECQRIEAVYEQMDAFAADTGLTDGVCKTSAVSPSRVFWRLGEKISQTPSDKRIAWRLLDKAAELATDESDVIVLHTIYMTMLVAYSADKDTDAKTQRKFIAACKKQIEIAEVVAEAWKTKAPGRPLPRHIGYEQVIDAHVGAHEFEMALRLSKQALKQGWPGVWKEAIRICMMKLEEEGRVIPCPECGRKMLIPQSPPTGKGRCKKCGHQVTWNRT